MELSIFPELPMAGMLDGGNSRDFRSQIQFSKTCRERPFRLCTTPGARAAETYNRIEFGWPPPGISGALFRSISFGANGRFNAAGLDGTA
jgi:hypothetical protein